MNTSLGKHIRHRLVLTLSLAGFLWLTPEHVECNDVKADVSSLPTEVRAVLPAGVISLSVEQFPAGATNKPLLIHLWTTASPTSHTRRSPKVHWNAEAPFYLHTFTRENKTKTWSLANAVAYTDDSEPVSVIKRWLKPQSKSGPVFIIESGTPMDTCYRLIAFPHGIEQTPSIQFFQNSVGANSQTYYRFDTLDARGNMTVIEVNFAPNPTGKPSPTVLHWNGHQFTEPNSR